MIRVLTYPSKKGEYYLKRILSRVEEYPAKLEKYVQKIGREVRKGGDRALLDYTKRFDGVELTPDELKIKEDEIERAYRLIDKDLLFAIKYAIQKIKRFHEKALPLSWFENYEEGITLGQFVRPVESAGLYIPGGKGGETPLISTVLMTAIPAKIAGVKKLVMVSPPRADKSLHPALLCAAREAGVNEIYKVGGPWSIFALANGTESIPKVDIICGPGNIYVTLAKKLISLHTGIDILAGPSEVLIVADEKANPEFVVWDLLAQAEHDPMSLSILITPSKKLLREVKKLLPEALERCLRNRIAKEAFKNRGALILVKSLDEAFDLSNRIAPEHLEIMTENPEEYLPFVKNAGAVFLGSYTPEAVGDYIAGPNHVLPTMGLSRFTSSLSVEKFLKKINFVKYSKEALQREGALIIKLAEEEKLPSHAEAVRIRINGK